METRSVKDKVDTVSTSTSRKSQEKLPVKKKESVKRKQQQQQKPQSSSTKGFQSGLANYQKKSKVEENQLLNVIVFDGGVSGRRLQPCL
jgi:hypothetical protein